MRTYDTIALAPKSWKHCPWILSCLFKTVSVKGGIVRETKEVELERDWAMWVEPRHHLAHILRQNRWGERFHIICFQRICEGEFWCMRLCLHVYSREYYRESTCRRYVKLRISFNWVRNHEQHEIPEMVTTDTTVESGIVCWTCDWVGKIARPLCLCD